jgi:hypothetical protein
VKAGGAILDGTGEFHFIMERLVSDFLDVPEVIIVVPFNPFGVGVNDVGDASP